MHKLLIFAATIAIAAPAAAQMSSSSASPAPGPAPASPAPGQQIRVKVMSDKVMTRTEVDQHVRKLFARFDVNHDGFVTHEEIASAAQGMMAMHGDMQTRFAERGMMMGDRGAVFDRLDANHDGSISRQEFMASEPKIQEQHVLIMRDGNAPSTDGQGRPQGMHGMHMFGMGMGGFGGHLLDLADSNHDGRVSLQEAEAAALAHFDRADLNHDGKLTPDERQQAHKSMREHRPS